MSLMKNCTGSEILEGIGLFFNFTNASESTAIAFSFFGIEEWPPSTLAVSVAVA